MFTFSFKKKQTSEPTSDHQFNIIQTNITEKDNEIKELKSSESSLYNDLKNQNEFIWYL